MTRTPLLCALLAFVPLLAAAQAPPLQDPLLDRLIGAWVLRGTIAGSQTTHDVVFDWVLDHQYVRFHEVSREKDAKGQPAYEAIVFIGWDEDAGDYACLWLDSTGGGGLAAQAIGHAKRSGDQLAFIFHGKDGSAFHTTFAYDKASASWQWLMDGEEGGNLKPFARVRLTRK
jgi:hypothetical protein